MKYYPFELHTHTLHSDGSFTPDYLVRSAKKVGLNGIALTDHNTVSGHTQTLKSCNRHGLTFIPGIEWTTFYGHITVLGAGTIIDWRSVNPSNILEKAKEVQALDGCIGIAHPCRCGHPICTGGSDSWGLSLKDYSAFTHYEIWSGMYPGSNTTNAVAINTYRLICDAGVKIACVYGRDWHRQGGDVYAMTFLGIDGSLSVDTALNAIKSRHTYISTGIIIDGILKGNNKQYQFGDIITEGDYRFAGRILNFDQYYIQKNNISIEKVIIYSDHNTTYESALDNNGSFSISFKASSSKYYQVVVVGSINGEKVDLALASPYFIC
ncbi:MAG: CehA/McbA family metallohydrolase [Christensenellaceae bacterium]|jgi:hypothetical protein|nr:CehA/McbA family metallohydrolase [Christensenellaceae bacterium]